MPKQIEELINDQLKSLEDVPASLRTETQNNEKKILRELLKDLDKFDRDNGQIKPTIANYERLASFRKKLKKQIAEVQKQSKDDYIKNLQNQINVNLQIYSEFGRINNQKSEAFIKFTVDNVIDNLNEADRVFEHQIKEIVFRSISIGGNYRQTVDQLTDFVLSDEERLGSLTRQVSRVAWDSYTQAIRSHADLIREGMTDINYKYVGVEVENTREFCQERIGKVFTDKQIREMAELEWAGKDPTTTSDNIFVKCGGFNCNHIFRPTLEEPTEK